MPVLEVVHELRKRERVVVVGVDGGEDALEGGARAALLPHARRQVQPVAELRVAPQRQQQLAARDGAVVVLISTVAARGI